MYLKEEMNRSISAIGQDRTWVLHRVALLQGQHTQGTPLSLTLTKDPETEAGKASLSHIKERVDQYLHQN